MLRDRAPFSPLSQQALDGGPVSVAWFGYDLSTAAGFTAALYAACDHVGAQQGGGVVTIPPGEYTYNATAILPTWVFTCTIATPCVVTKASHGLVDGDTFIPSTTGALPTGLVMGDTYYVKRIDADTFNLSATLGGASINTSGSQSGTHTAVLAPVASTSEGYTLLLDASRDNITIRGAGYDKTILKPATNRITLFLQMGATSSTFEDMRIDNSDNGILTNQVQANPIIPGTGIAGEGNGANCAIRSGLPGNITVRRMRFKSICHNIHVIGDWSDVNVLGGDVLVEDVEWDSFVFGVLALQYSNYKMDRWHAANGVDRQDFGGGTAAGHVFYGSNRTGAEPLTNVIANGSAENCSSSPLKIRKGYSVAWSNFAFKECGRGFDVENLHSFTLTGFNVSVADVVNDSFRSGLHLTGLANAEVSNGVINRSGVNALGVQIEETGGSGAAPKDKNLHVHDITVIDDLAGQTSRPAFLVQGITDADLDGLIYRTTADVANTVWAVELEDCTRVNVNRPKRRSAEGNNPSGSDRLVRLDAGCTDCVVEYARSDLHVAPTNNTVSNGGTNTVVARADGTVSGTWTPVATFATPGDFASTYSEQVGWFKRQGDWITVGCRLTFTANSYTTAAGVFRIGGLGSTAADTYGAPFENALARHANITATTTQLGVRMSNNTNYFTLRDNDTGGAGGQLDTANIPAGAANVALAFEITFRIVET